MRLSVDELNTPELADLCMHARVELNGERIDNVIWADEGLGQLERYVILDGNLVDDGTGNAATEKCFGTVRIIDMRLE